MTRNIFECAVSIIYRYKVSPVHREILVVFMINNKGRNWSSVCAASKHIKTTVAVSGVVFTNGR